MKNKTISFFINLNVKNNIENINSVTGNDFRVPEVN